VKWGRYIDRVGVRGPMYTGAALLLAGLLAGYAVPRLEMLFVVSTLAGSGFMIYHIAVNQAAGLLGTPETRTRNFTVLALAFSTSSFLGPVLAGFAIDAIGHRNTFALLSISVVIMLAIMATRRIEVPRHATALKPGEKKHVADLLRIPAMRRVFAVSGTLSMAWDLFTFVMPIHGSKLGLSASTVGLILGAFGAAVFVVRLMMPFIAPRVTEWKLILAAMFLSGATLAIVPLVTDVTLLIAAAFVLGLGLGGTQPMIMSLIYSRSPPGRGGEAVGVRTLLLNFSQAGIPLMFGALGTALGMTPVFLTMALALVGGAWYARKGG
jgi:MFS family permease